MQLLREILNRIVYETDADGNIIAQRAASSSINLPTIAQRLNDPNFNVEMEPRRIFV